MCGSIAAVFLTGCTEGDFGEQPSRPATTEQRLGMLKYDLQKNPDSAASLKEYGDIQAGLGQWNQAMGAYREALLVAPGDREALLGYGEAQLALGDYAGALDTTNKAGGGDLRSALLQSGALAGLNQLDQARTVLEAAAKSYPRNLDVRSNLGIVAALQQDPMAYGIARAAAFAPDASYTHRRNLILVGGITGAEGNARADGPQLGLEAADVSGIIGIGRRARTQGASAFGVIPGA
ncbi:tetratricopeptide repeat protein [Paracoccus sp. (in: a-proteobacteria)]|uniref:tetratricopeptide repeat protein n=1 Tax=Paracoccus sp. TaxID=267 RepID=UPI003A8434BD